MIIPAAKKVIEKVARYKIEFIFGNTPKTTHSLKLVIAL